MNPTMEIRKLNQADIEGKFFDHQFTKDGRVTGSLVVVREHSDGYVDVRPFTGKGLAAATSAWSGCLFPAGDMKDDVRKLAVEARKI